MNKPIRIILSIITVIILIAMCALSYLQGAKVFGAFGGDGSELTYEYRADNYYNGGFHNETELPNNLIDETDHNKNMTTGKGTYPEEDLPVVDPSFGNCPADDIEITWYGHSTLLITMHELNILVDPVFSDYLGLNKLLGSKRFEKIHSYAKDLPHIDICLLTHDHFDHLDYQSIRELDDRIDTYITPLGVDKRLERFGVSSEKITDMSWWEELNMDGLNIACTPCQHTSGRMLLDKTQTLWCSYVLFDKQHKVYLSGDSGFSTHFEEIHDKYGDMDLMFTDGAQYGEEKDKHTNHMFPEESAKATTIMGAKTAMLYHWGSFCLSNWHAWDDPPTRYSKACDELGINYITPMIGQTFRLSDAEDLKNQDLREHWWESLK